MHIHAYCAICMASFLWTVFFPPILLYREQFRLVLASSLLSLDGQLWAWFWSHTGSLYSSGLYNSYFHVFQINLSLYNFKVDYGIYFAVASGQHWQFSCKGYLFSVGWSNSHISDRYVYFGTQMICYSIFVSNSNCNILSYFFNWMFARL